MRWWALYLRSRLVPAALAVIGLGTLGAWLATRLTGSPGLSLTILATSLGVGASTPGLIGADPELERTAAFRWPPRRAAHVLAIAIAVAGATLLTHLTANPLATPGVIIRDAGGLAGLGALGALFRGNQFAWALPVAWAACAVTVLPPDNHLLNWLAAPPDNATAAIAATVLGLAGVLAYPLLGPRTR